MAALKVLRHALLRLLVLSLVALAGVQFYFVARIALMAVIAPESTAFERSEIYRITKTTGVLPWRQQWMPYAKISVNLQRAVIASEDASVTEHDGLPRWHQLPRLPEPRRRGEVRRGVPPLPRAESDRRDVLLCLFCPLRARLPPWRH